MKTSIVFGDGCLEVELPDEVRVVREGPSVPLPVVGTEEAVAAALAAPLDQMAH